MSNKISLEQSLQAYRVMNTPAKFSWKQHWAQETFSSPDFFTCTEDEQKQFIKRLQECTITICQGITSKVGRPETLDAIIDILTDTKNKDIKKIQKPVIYSSSTGSRPVGDAAYETWNGFQVIDLDIKDAELSDKLKPLIFDELKKWKNEEKDLFFILEAVNKNEQLSCDNKRFIIDNLLPEIKENEKCFSHGDFCLPNIFFNKTNKNNFFITLKFKRLYTLIINLAKVTNYIKYCCKSCLVKHYSHFSPLITGIRFC